LELEGSDSRRVAALNQEVATLRDELDIAQGSIDRLAERLDFTERLLTRGSTSEDDVEGDASR
jgi:outer membrane protein TolC